MRIPITVLLAVMCGGPLAAQSRRTATAASQPAVSWRPFVLASGEQFAAAKTFDAVFGARSIRPFWGGGLRVDLRRGLFVEVAVSRFSATGQRAFVNGGQVFPLGIPLKTTITPFEVTGGYRYQLSKVIVPYVGLGVVRDAYSETSTFNDAGEDVAESHAGFLVVGGAEFRVHRRVGVGVDAQYTHVPGILGVAGVSQAFGEKDLGGTAIRVKILVGR
jgi:hypothetical protein